MHIFVLIKQVPETDKVKMDPESGTMVRSGQETISIRSISMRSRQRSF